MQKSSKDGREILAGTLLEQYKNNPGLTKEKNNETLQKIQNLGLNKTEQNLNTASILLNDANSDEEKITLIRIIGNFYSPNDHLTKNQDVLKKIRDAAASKQPNVAAAAALTYSRLGYFTDTVPLLKRSMELGFLKKNEYAGELAHLIWHAKLNEQRLLATELSANDSIYAAEILANYFSDESYREKINPDLKFDILEYVIKNEPAFSNTIGEYSIFHALAYSEWLHTVALLTNDTQTESYDRVIMRYLGQVTSSPKKIIAYLSSEQGQKFLSSAPNSDAKILLDKINHYSENPPYPRSPVVWIWLRISNTSPKII